jgi:hypothetical protein
MIVPFRERVKEGLGLLIDRDAHNEGVVDPRGEWGKGRYPALRGAKTARGGKTGIRKTKG